jgi:tRNA modification GTPase
MSDTDTIAAISSPVGEGGIGIVRMSGSKAHSILKGIFRPRHAVESYDSHHLYLGFLHDPHRDVDVDEVFAVFMDEPRTYTREKMAEVYCHGGLAAQRQVLVAALQAGARMAEPGEFTKRAFLNGRIDLAQAESVLEIIESESSRELESALAHVKGQLSEKLGEVRNHLLAFLAEVEAEIDFPDEELSIRAESWRTRIDEMEKSVVRLSASYYEGRAMTQGLSVLILGRSNVGKSSLLNTLTLSERAIVTPIPGTTRDPIDDTIHINGIKLKITDTAGLRTSEDPIEKEGIERARKKIPDADVILWVLDGSMPYTGEDNAVYAEVVDNRVIAVINKSDLPQKIEDLPLDGKSIPVLKVSALTGTGVEALKEAIIDRCLGSPVKSASLVITNIRHRDVLQRMADALNRASESCASGSPLEITAFELRDAMSCLGEITGETCPEAVIDHIFSRFCIGK